METIIETETAPPSMGGETSQREFACSDGKDNENDGLIDCDDPDCVVSASCRCNALSCGDVREPGSTVSCVPAQGCFCDNAAGCVPCRNKNETCGESTECCAGLDLHCGTVTVSSGQLEKRCITPIR